MKQTAKSTDVPKRGKADTFAKLPNLCPKCSYPNGTEAATGKMGHWFRHRLTGFHGVQCGQCGYLVEVGVPALATQEDKP